VRTLRHPLALRSARVELRERYAADPAGLAEHLTDQLVIAAREAGGPPAELYERFVEWTP
jgi:hypothetical protein